MEDVDGQHAARVVETPRQEGAADLANFRRALSHLPQDQREAVVLVGAVGFTYDETAEVCGVSPGTIKSRVNRARRRLEELMDREVAETAPESGTAAEAAPSREAS